ncbi:TPA: hypothetical protein ACKN8D_000194 [Neisseria gonorrhoeae]
MADCPGRIGIGSGGVFSGFGSKQGRHSALIWCFIYWGKTDSQKYHWNMVMLPYIFGKEKENCRQARIKSDEARDSAFGVESVESAVFDIFN